MKSNKLFNNTGLLEQQNIITQQLVYTNQDNLNPGG